MLKLINVTKATSQIEFKHMLITLHQTHHTIADFDSIYLYLEKLLDVEKYQNDTTIKPEGFNFPKGIHLFPELFLTGYPIKDLCLFKPFTDRYQQFLDKIDSWSINVLSHLYKRSKPINLLMGGIAYKFDDNGVPVKIENVIYSLIPGKKLEKIYVKKLLPSYDIFDETKYFTNESDLDEKKGIGFYEWENYKIFTFICEDMWPSNRYSFDPTQAIHSYLKARSESIDLIINLSASPYHINKIPQRINRACEISNLLKAPFVYVNRVGGEDEILFDGSSFIVIGDKIFTKFKMFSSETKTFNTSDFIGTYSLESENTKPNVWESLFSPNINFKSKPLPKMQEWDDETCNEVLNALAFGFNEYAYKNGFNNFVVALSGGMDSTLVLTIIKLFLKQNQTLTAIYMPGIYSSGLSTQLAENLCKNISVPLLRLPIKFIHSTVKNLFKDQIRLPLTGFSDENIQSRLRGLLLYGYANEQNAMVVNTSNKSEIGVGYSTQYGDSVGAISMLGDLYKTEVYQLAKYINRRFDNPIPIEIIERAPSAELRENQTDQDSLPPYDRLDVILESIISNFVSTDELNKYGFNKEEVDKTFKMYQKSEFKRWQFCPIIKVKNKSFGFGYRMPLSKTSLI